MASRRGRKRKNGTKREPSGRVQRPEADQVRAVALAQRLKVVSISDARSELAGFPLGVLFLKRRIPERVYVDAGIKWAQLASVFAHIMGIPKPTPIAGQMNVSYGVSIGNELPPHAVAEWKSRYRAAHSALVDAGADAYHVTNDVCIRDAWLENDCAKSIDSLNTGLRALASCFYDVR